MCLDVNWWSIKHTAKKDIIVYKYLSGEMDKSLYTPFWGMPITIGIMYDSPLYRNGNKVEDGLHSFKSLKNIEKDVRFNTPVKCIIPKGSKYYKGTWGGYTAYTSDKLKYIEIIQ